ncbi:DUF418 domain-containing protein [Kocuria massiliensis]|uniref:DUF418 domain-containing protein n=1 Tax=Kocuria massiliensis TaxID=1926282 RepID=UPI0022B963F7|nr:DUF418 domain-containing protein [Kocuria massiliensis]
MTSEIIDHQRAADAAVRAPAPGRIQELDVLRGLALSGILLVNAPAILGLGGVSNETRMWLDDFVQQRFFPIFSLLFGIGYGLMWTAARAKGESPRWAMIRRFSMLAVLGAVHQVLQPGEALLGYGLAGLLILVPSTWIPDRARVWVTLAGGLVLTALSVTMASGGLAMVPGLFLLGCALGSSTWVRRMTTYPVLTCSIAVVLVVADAAVYLTTTRMDRLIDMSFTAQMGLLGALTYAFVALALMTTPLRRVMVAVFSPLGKMALTNYIGATLVVTVAGILVPDLRGSEDSSSWTWCMIGCVALLALQWACSTAWLRTFTQGPLERIWRRVTWWGTRRMRPLRTNSAA